MRSAVPSLTALAILVAALGLAAACGGGGTAGGTTPASAPAITVEIIDDVGRPKLADLGSGLSAIYSDQLDRGDPQEATHARLRLMGTGGNVAMEKVIPLRRQSDKPYWVDVDSRRITLEQLPYGRDFSLRLDLGRDFGFSRLRIKETVYYRGETSGLTVTEQGVFQGERMQGTIAIPLKLLVDTSADYLYLQGYADYRSLPDAGISPPLPGIDTPKNPIVVADTIGSFSTTYSTGVMVQGPYEGAFPHFYFLPRIDQQVQGLLLSVNSGPPLFKAFVTFVSRADILAGKAILVDWETTFSSCLVAPYLGIRSLNLDDAANYQAVVDRFRRLFAILEDRVSRFGSAGEAISVSADEVTAFKARAEILRLVHEGDFRAQLRSPNAMVNGMLAALAFDPLKGIDLAFISKGRPVTITRDDFAPIQVTDAGSYNMTLMANILKDKMSAEALFNYFDKAVPTP